MSTRETDSNKVQSLRDYKTKGSEICPVCGLRATSRYLNQIRKVWIYKHNKMVKVGRGREMRTTYHEANR